MATQTLITAEEFDQLPEQEGRRFELLDGEMIEMPTATARHNFIQMRLGAELHGWLKESRGAVLPTTEFAFGSNRFQPDLAVLLAAKWKEVEQSRCPVLIIPDIAVEIVSPSESAWNLDRKIGICLSQGVSEVWIVYPDSQHMLIYGANGIRNLVHTDRLETPLLPGWSIALSEVFAT